MGLGLGAFGFYDVETIVADSGAPSLVIIGQALVESQARGITHWHITLTHTKTTAIAHIIAESRLA